MDNQELYLFLFSIRRLLLDSLFTMPAAVVPTVAFLRERGEPDFTDKPKIKLLIKSPE